MVFSWSCQALSVKVGYGNIAFAAKSGLWKVLNIIGTSSIDADVVRMISTIFVDLNTGLDKVTAVLGPSKETRVWSTSFLKAFRSRAQSSVTL